MSKGPFKEGMTVVDYIYRAGLLHYSPARIVGLTGKVYAVDIQHLTIEIVTKEAAQQSLKNIQPVLVDSFNTGAGLNCRHCSAYRCNNSHWRPRIFIPRNPSFAEIRRNSILGLQSYEPGESRRIVEGTGLFVVTKVDGRDLQLVRK